MRIGFVVKGVWDDALVIRGDHLPSSDRWFKSELRTIIAMAGSLEAIPLDFEQYSAAR